MDTSKTKKITIVHQSLAGGTGVAGAARLKNMIKIFQEMEMEVNLVTFSFFSDKFWVEHKIEDSLDIKMVHLPAKMPKILKSLAFFPILYYTLKSSKNSAYIFSDFITEIAYLPAIISSKIFKKPLILDYIDTSFFKIIPNFVRKSAARNSDLLFAISLYLEQFAKNEFGCSNVRYVPNGIDVNKFKKDEITRNIYREKLNLNKDDIVIGYTGSFAYYEGVPILLRSFKNLKNRYNHVKLAIMGRPYFAGDEDIHKMVKDLNLEEDVIMIPSQPYEMVPNFLNAFDILCCSKLDCEINRVANPVKVVEYMSMGLPTVCSSVGGIKDTITDSVDGFLVEPGNEKELENVLEDIITNPKKPNEIAENGRKTVVSQYSIEVIQKLVEEAIKSLN